MEKEKEGTADNEGLTEERKMFDKYKNLPEQESILTQDEADMLSYAHEHITITTSRILTKRLAQYKASLLDRLPKEGSIAPCKECLLEVKSLIEGDK